MNKLANIGILLAAAIITIGMSGCEGDQGPAGPPGTASCMGCHTDQFDDELATFLKPFQTQFSFSKHGTGDTFERNSSTCARCHTSEGFQHFVNTGEAIGVPGSSQIHCFTCHAPHSTENFSLRTESAVAIDVGGTYDKGTSNICATCHQARVANPPIADGLSNLSRRWGPHHGPQSNVLAGIGAYEFDGPYSTNAQHNGISNGCVTCHMAEPEGPLVGGHSFWLAEEGGDEINVNGCSCHPTWNADSAFVNVEATRSAFLDRLNALAADMEALGWIDADAHNGFVNKTLPGSEDLIVWTADQLGAIWNWEMLKEDLSGSVHNVVFANAVLNATQAFVDTQNPSGILADNMTMKSE